MKILSAVLAGAGVIFGIAPQCDGAVCKDRLTLEAEIPTIRKAAERNGIKFGSDDWFILLAIRKAENGRTGYLQEKELQYSMDLVQYNKMKGFLWKRNVPNVAKLSPKVNFTNTVENVRNVQEKLVKTTGINKTKKLYLPVEKNNMPKIEKLFLQINEGNTLNIVNRIWNVLVNNGSDKDQKFGKEIAIDGFTNKEPYICYSNNNVEDDAKYADMTKTKRRYTGIICTQQKNNLEYKVSGCPLWHSRQLLKKLQNANSCVLIATTKSTIQHILKPTASIHQNFLNVFETSVSFTTCYETDGLQFGIMNPKAYNLDKQAGWAAATIIKNRKRWAEAGRLGTFIEFLASRYCPKECDAAGNFNWKKNVKFWFEKFMK